MSLPTFLPWPFTKLPLWKRMETALRNLLERMMERPNESFKGEHPFCQQLAASLRQLHEVWIEAGLHGCTWEYKNWSPSRAGGCARSLLGYGLSTVGDSHIADALPEGVAQLLWVQDPKSHARDTISPPFVDSVRAEIEQFAEILLNSTKPPTAPSDADAGSKPKGVTPEPTEPEEADLTDRQEMILATMLEHGITSERRRETRRAIVGKINRKHNPQNYNRDFAELVRRGHLKSREGPDGGVWMTPQGKAAAERLHSAS
jgi:hypothetical protein